jgi:hypothetical protein
LQSFQIQAIKLFSELKSPVEVVIALDLPADQVLAIYQEYWELDHMYRLAQIYEEAKYDLHDLLRLHRIVKGLGTEKQDIINVLDLVKHNQLQTLQWKVGNLRYEINMLEIEKTKAMNHLFNLKRMIYELQSSLAQKRDMALMNQESGKYDNSGNLYPVPYIHPIEEYEVLIYFSIVIHFAAASYSIVMLKRQIRKWIYRKKRILKIAVY